jgi:type I restriction enzyme, S subunit
MQIARASWKQLQTRIDPQFYHPQHIADLLSINRFTAARLDDLRLRDTKMSYGVLKPRFTESQFRLARIQNFADPFLQVDDCEGIEEDQFFEYSRSECRQGDILIAIGGYVGRAVITPSIPFRLNINQHIARFRLGKDVGVDPYFLVTYLISSIGRRQVTRYVSGSVQVGINLEDLREIKIPKPHLASQAYIGDKVRQAERLRAQARFLKQSANQLIDLLVEGSISEEEITTSYREGLRGESEVMRLLSSRLNSSNAHAVKNKNAESTTGNKSPEHGFSAKLLKGRAFVSRIRSEKLRARLDPGGYHPELLSVSRVLEASGLRAIELAQAGDFMSSARATVEANVITLFISILHVDAKGNVDLAEARLHKPESKGIVCEDGDVLISCINPKENRVAVFRSHESAACSLEFSLFRPNKFHPDYVSSFLRSSYGLRQMIHLGRGTSSSRRRIDEAELMSVLILDLEEDTQNCIGEISQTAGQLDEQQRYLIVAAKLLVEALIEGKLSEAELKEAQESLERGECEADRAILARLTRKGIDVAGEPPLFPDLDALYGALDQAAGSHEEAAAD